MAFWLLLRLLLVTFAVVVAVLLTALMMPLSRALRRAGLPAAASALLAVLALAAVLLGIGFLVGFRAASAVQDLTPPLAAGIDRIRVWAIEGPLGLDPQQVADIRNEIVTWLYQASAHSTAGARMAVYVLGGLILVAFLVFFLLKDGAAMWAGLLERGPSGGATRSTGPAVRRGRPSPATCAEPSSSRSSMPSASAQVCSSWASRCGCP